ncbi:lysine transporter LysE [Brachybacterium phenoliresistens]|uniref:Lysine transporter LysE n=1 Tax=Brachybacterium phenoliresistens TaxID=396014 RepID=Z9JPM8_9MICO|nr:lysine transporter LysE [Brachybacterium phenoliresistens]
MSPAAAAAMALTALVMVLTPGPNMVYLASRSIGQGRRAGLVSLAGTGTGFLAYLLLTALGLAAVLVAVPWLFIGIKALGVLYLVHLAWTALRPGGRGVLAASDLPPDGAGRLFRAGLLTNLLNPKTAILYLSVIPQFLDPSRGGALLQVLALGLVQITVSLAVNALIILAAGSVAAVLAQRPRWVRWQRWISGTLLGAVALLLAREVPARARL